MRMPRQDGYIVAIDDLADLQITVEHMLAIGFSFVSQLTVIRVFGLSEPAEEQKQIADTDSVRQILKFFDVGTASEYLDKMLEYRKQYGV